MRTKAPRAKKVKVKHCPCGHINSIKIVKAYHQEYPKCPVCKEITYTDMDWLSFLNEGIATFDPYLERFAYVWG